MTDKARARTCGYGEERAFGPWRAARVVLAAMFVTAGATKLSVASAFPAPLPGPAWAALAVVEIGGGLMLLIPVLASLAAAVLVAASGAILMGSFIGASAPVPWPALVLVPALAALGCVCRPGALARARLERAIDRFMVSQDARGNGGCSG